MDIQELLKNKHTSCKSCVFAIYKDKTQTGCEFNLLDEYVKIPGVEKLECVDSEDGTEFYALSNTLCLWYRTTEWGGDSNIDTLKKQINLENKIVYDVVIYIPESFQYNDLEILFDNIKLLNKHNIKPNNFVIFKHKGDVKPSYIASNLNNMGISNYTVNQSVEEEFQNKYKLMESVVSAIQSPYFLIIDYDKITSVPNDYVSSINNDIYVNLTGVGYRRNPYLFLSKALFKTIKHITEDPFTDGYSFVDALDKLVKEKYS